DLLIQAGTNNPGDTIFSSNQGQTAVIMDNGDVGIGPDFTVLSVPMGRLDVDGSLYVGNEGIYDRDDGETNIKGTLIVDGGKVTGANGEYITIGAANNTITLFSNGLERMRVNSNGFVGVGVTAPSTSLQAAGIIFSTAGLRGSSVTIGAFDSNSLATGNEIRTQIDMPLVLQNNFPFGSRYYVGIGTDTPVEKLHVGGSVRAENGIIAATAAFSGAVAVSGNFTANNKLSNSVELSSTNIYGNLTVSRDLTVYGNIVRQGGGGNPAYLDAANTFGNFYNTFSSDVFASRRLGVGVTDFDFPEASYLQVGDPVNTSTNAIVYISGGSSGNAILKFHRGSGPGSEAARFETRNGPNLALMVGNSTKTFTDATYHRIENSVLWVSTGYNTPPAIFVSSANGNVAMGTTVLDILNPPARLTVQGNIRLAGQDGAGNDHKIIFADGSSMDSAATVGSAYSLSNNGDALVEADIDTNGAGNVILKSGGVTGLTVKSGGNIAIGGQFVPSSLVNIRNGDLVLGALVQSGGTASEDLFVGGNVLGYGDINAANNIKTGGTVRISNTGAIGSGGGNATWDGGTIPVNRGGTGNTVGNAATVTTNANLTGDVTSVGNATTLTNAPVIAKVLTGYTSGAGAITAADSILSAIQKLNGNDATNANLTGDVTSVGNATTLTNAPVIAKVLTGYTSGAGAITAADSILSAIQKLNGNDATNANLSGMVTSAGNVTTVVTNANLTGDVTSVGNATTLTNAPVIAKV
ncbi:MAG TPA: hypothetical protein PKI19_10155, partial [Elusimicrobiales bacterium]|nr:hypothetical protein [Elusimicrobiales bacterium]